MPVKTRVAFSIGKGVEFSNEALMKEVGLLARELILRRTRRGVSAEGTPFAPYSPEYRALKALQLGSASPVNLTASGGMLNALRIVRTTKTSVTLGFA